MARTRLALLVAIQLLMAQAVALAQWGGPAFEPRFTTKDLENAAATLQLTPEQLATARELHEAYLSEFAAACDKMKAYMKEYSDIVNSQPASEHAWDEWHASYEKFTKHGDRLGEQFFSDFKLGLTPAQIELWPRIERRMYRQKFISYGWFAGDRVDLIALVESLKVPDDLAAHLDPLLEAYESELDPALHARQTFIERKMDEVRKLWEAKDMDALATYYAEGRELCCRVRDINLRHVRLIAGELPAELSERFTLEFNQQAFQQVYQATRGETLLKAARELDSLSASEREELDAIERTLSGGLRSLRERWAAAIVKYETERSIAQVYEDETGNGDRFQEQAQAVATLSDRAVERLRQALTPDQLDKLPGLGRPKDLPKIEF